MPTVPAQQQPDPQTTETAALAAIILALLASDDPATVTATLTPILARLGIDPRAVRASVELVLPHVHPSLAPVRSPAVQFPPVPRGSAQAQIVRTGVARQAAYLLNSSRRINAEIAGGAPPRQPPMLPPTTSGEPLPGGAGRHVAGTREERVRAFGERSRERIVRAVQDPRHRFPVDHGVMTEATMKERRFFAQHLAAERARVEAARRVDAVAAELGLATLGWYAIRDERTTPECLAAHGSNFTVARPPRQGYPGTLHGGTCRCRPGPPFPGRPLVDEVLLSRSV